eukprot:14542664-Alexandrium_andersonii.AAC.1
MQAWPPTPAESASGPVEVAALAALEGAQEDTILRSWKPLAASLDNRPADVLVSAPQDEGWDTVVAAWLLEAAD